MPPTAPRRQITAVGVLTALAGTALFAWLIWTVGPAEIWSGFRQIGWNLAWILLLGGLRFAIRAAAWAACIEPPHRLPLTSAFSAVVSGDALGNATPLGPLVGEPAKIASVRHRVPVAVALTALAIENVFYTLSVALMIAAGALALILVSAAAGGIEVPQPLRDFSAVAVGAIALLFAAAGWVLWRRPAVIDTLFSARARAGTAEGRPKSGWALRAEKLRTIEREVFTFASRRHRHTLQCPRARRHRWAAEEWLGFACRQAPHDRARSLHLRLPPARSARADRSTRAYVSCARRGGKAPHALVDPPCAALAPHLIHRRDG